MFGRCIVRQLQTVASSGGRQFRDIYYSGIQPSGVFHLGNYFGAVRSLLDIQKDPANFFILGIVDLHALSDRVFGTDRTFADNRFDQVLDTFASLLACGIDPDRITVYQQSRVSQHTELAWILSGLISARHLEGMGHYRDKSARYFDNNPPLSLLNYPVLQAADILLYRATKVPVGEDQAQHLDVARKLARSFEKAYKIAYFPEPQTVQSQHPRVRSLRDPARKMSKSDPSDKGRITIGDTPSEVRSKIRKALTDFTSQIFYDPVTRPAVSNLIDIERMITGKSPDVIKDECADLNTVQYKDRLAEVIVSVWEPIHERFLKLQAEPDMLKTLLEDGNERVGNIAAENMREIRQIVGLDDQDSTIYNRLFGEAKLTSPLSSQSIRESIRAG